jgi:hypothetical protein
MKNSAGIAFSPFLKRLLLTLALLNGLVGIKRIVESFSSPDIFRKDFIQEYLMAKAILNGLNPYLPVPELAGLWVSDSTDAIPLRHSTPHPPIVGLLSAPFGLFSYRDAAVVWLFFEIACLLATISLFQRWWGQARNNATLLLLFGCALGWGPVVEELWLGQLSSCLLLLFLGAWLALREEKSVMGGALIGGIIALKLMAWPFVIFLTLRRKWKGVIAAAAVVGTANLSAMAALGVDCVKSYYLKVGPSIAAIYRLHDTNYSTWTVGQRLFAGFGYNIQAPPLWPSETLAWLCTYLVPATVLLAGLWFALRADNFDTAFSLLIIVGILVSPITWSHYVMLASIPLVIIARRLWTLGCPRRMSYFMFGVLLMLSIVGPTYSFISSLLASQVTQEGLPVVHPAVGLLTLVPLAVLTGLLWMVWRLDHVRLPTHNQGDLKNEHAGQKRRFLQYESLR